MRTEVHDIRHAFRTLALLKQEPMVLEMVADLPLEIVESFIVQVATKLIREHILHQQMPDDVSLELFGALIEFRRLLVSLSSLCDAAFSEYVQDIYILPTMMGIVVIYKE